MPVRSRIQRIVAIVAALLLMSVGTGLASTVYRCAVDGKARDACCCPQADSKQEMPQSDPVASSACCCEVEIAKATTTDPRHQAERHDAAKIALAAIVTVDVLAPPPPRHAVAPRSVVRVPGGPPLILQKCSLLL